MEPNYPTTPETRALAEQWLASIDAAIVPGCTFSSRLVELRAKLAAQLAEGCNPWIRQFIASHGDAIRSAITDASIPARRARCPKCGGLLNRYLSRSAQARVEKCYDCDFMAEKEVC